MKPSRNVLSKYGNTSSVSILFVIDELLKNSDLKKGEYLCALAFGPGLSMELALFRIV
jgi:predicted naringenin-chalcone synthase